MPPRLLMPPGVDTPTQIIKLPDSYRTLASPHVQEVTPTNLARSKVTEQMPKNRAEVVPATNIRSDSDQFWSIWAKLWRNLANFGQSLPASNLDRVWSTLGKLGPNLARAQPSMSKSRQTFANRRIRPEFGRTRQTLSNLRQTSPNFAMVWPKLARFRQPWAATRLPEPTVQQLWTSPSLPG